MKDNPPTKTPIPHPTYHKQCIEMLHEFDELDEDDQDLAILFMQKWRCKQGKFRYLDNEVKILGSEANTAFSGEWTSSIDQ